MSRKLYDQWLNADLVVYASPLYHSSLNAIMKIFIERTYPILDPQFRYDQNNVMFSFRHKHPMVLIKV